MGVIEGLTRSHQASLSKTNVMIGLDGNRVCGCKTEVSHPHSRDIHPCAGKYRIISNYLKWIYCNKRNIIIVHFICNGLHPIRYTLPLWTSPSVAM